MNSQKNKYKNIKISIIVPIYNSENYLERCLESIVNQTYKNLEIILVNDASQGNAEEICRKYKVSDSRIKYVKHQSNLSLFQARVTGLKNATGDYVAFCDSDDYVSPDFYRVLVFKAIESGADITVGNTVIQRTDGSKFVYNLRTDAIGDLDKEDCLREFLKQGGLNFDWHTVWNKLYSKKIVDLAMPSYKKQTEYLNMCEDIAFSVPLFFYAQRVRSVKSVSYFYCQNEKALTDASTSDLSKFKKNIGNLVSVFNFVKAFLKENKVFDKYENYFNIWKHTYNRSWTETIKSSKLNDSEKASAYKLLSRLVRNKENIKPEDYYFSSLYTEFNESIDNLKKSIINQNIKYISFDVFDTAICRPFLNPSDLFTFLNTSFRKLLGKNTLIEFSEIRVLCENEVRTKTHEQDVTLDEIYSYMETKYDLPKEVAEKLKKEEVELENNFTMLRESIYEIYQMCLYLGKRVVFTSDNYLPKTVIASLLSKNGYNEYYRLYVSSEIKLTKESGDLYKYVLDDLKIADQEIMHIGDNYIVDYERAKSLGLNAFYYPKCKDVFFGFTSLATNNCGAIFTKRMRTQEDNLAALDFIGTRTMLAIISKKYFDNPFISFNSTSDFNGDPYFIGYYVLGLYVFSIVHWLFGDLEENKKTHITFMSRDGYLFKQVFDILAPVYGSNISSDYLYMSRKALVPFLINNKMDWYKLSSSFINYKHTGSQILKYLDFTLDDERLDKKEQIYKSCGININKELKNKEEFDRFVSITYNKFFDEKKYKKYLDSARRYFRKKLPEGSAIFDVGYSGKPESVLSSLCERSYDTYFVNINRDEPLKNAKASGFKLKTFFNYRPKIVGVLSEYLVSELAPSCVSYEIAGDIIRPVFEKTKFSYQEQFLVKSMQAGAIDFVKDLTKIFKGRTEELYFQDFDMCLPYNTFVYSPRYFDKQIFSLLNFEDDLGGLKTFKLLDFWNYILDTTNVLPSDELFMRAYNVEYSKPNLSGKSKLMRFVYYLLYDRSSLKEYTRNKIKNKTVLNTLQFGYKLLRKGKKLIYYSFHPKVVVHKLKLKLVKD